MKQDLWFGVYGREYKGNEPAFFDDDFSWRRYLHDQFPIIKRQIEPLMSHDADWQPYFDAANQFPPKHWKTIGLMTWGNPTYHYSQLTELNQVLAKIPGLVSASISMLEPHARILPHYGETNAVFRVHLGITVPADSEKCFFTVKGEKRSWQEGKTLVFLDANMHEARNDTDERRYILLLDVMRPEFAHLQRRVCVQSLAVLSLFWVMAHIPFMPLDKIRTNAQRIPRWIPWLLIQPLRVVWYLAWPLMTRSARR